MPAFREGLSFDDVLLIPKETLVLPSEVDTSTTFLPGIVLRVPIVSAPMDTVTDARLAIAMAREGGVGATGGERVRAGGGGRGAKRHMRGREEVQQRGAAQSLRLVAHPLLHQVLADDGVAAELVQLAAVSEFEPVPH